MLQEFLEQRTCEGYRIRFQYDVERFGMIILVEKDGYTLSNLIPSYCLHDEELMIQSTIDIITKLDGVLRC